ncbi:hypothetical protein HAX54_011083, partial [Datura stramonium]|nr:hypothetical protein [Datura stramonium]
EVAGIADPLSQMIMMPQDNQINIEDKNKGSPVKTLHDLVSRNFEALKGHVEQKNEDNNDKMEEDAEEDSSQGVLQADSSPKTVKKGNRKGKKQGRGECQLPTRVVPKRAATKSHI